MPNVSDVVLENHFTSLNVTKLMFFHNLQFYICNVFLIIFNCWKHVFGSQVFCRLCKALIRYHTRYTGRSTDLQLITKLWKLVNRDEGFTGQMRLKVKVLK